MPKGVFVNSVDFVKGFVAGSREGLTMKEIAESLGMEYNACAARKKSLDKQFEGFDRYQAATGKRGRKISETEMAAIADILND